MSNKILLRFLSESAASFDQFKFNSNSVTYKEILDFLERKKKIGSAGKTDQVALFNIDENRFADEKDINIYAGARFLVERRPPEAALKQQTQNVGGQTSDVIELTYNPKQI
jgi:hypothetical protein